MPLGRVGELEQALLEDALELQPDLHLRRDDDQTDAGPGSACGSPGTTRWRRADRRRQLPPWVVGSRAARRIPGDVGVRVEVLDDRLAD